MKYFLYQKFYLIFSIKKRNITPPKMEEENSSKTDSNDFDQYIQDLLLGKKPLETTIAKICAKVISFLKSSLFPILIGKRNSRRRAKYRLITISNDNLWQCQWPIWRSPWNLSSCRKTTCNNIPTLSSWMNLPLGNELCVYGQFLL